MVPFADLANHSFTFNTTFCVGRDRQRYGTLHSGQWHISNHTALFKLTVLAVSEPKCRGGIHAQVQGGHA
jgi:hypothetical protein